jgi:hypothetical protein
VNTVHSRKLKDKVLGYLPIVRGTHSFVKTVQLVLKLKWCGGTLQQPTSFQENKKQTFEMAMLPLCVPHISTL